MTVGLPLTCCIVFLVIGILSCWQRNETWSHLFGFFFPWNNSFKIVTAYDLLLPHQLIKLIDEINCSNWSENFFLQKAGLVPHLHRRGLCEFQGYRAAPLCGVMWQQRNKAMGLDQGRHPGPSACNLGVWESRERHNCTMNTRNVVSQQGTYLSGTKAMGC